MNVKMYNGNDTAFLAACKKADVKPTHRQYRKWVNQRGSAYNQGR